MRPLRWHADHLAGADDSHLTLAEEEQRFALLDSDHAPARPWLQLVEQLTRPNLEVDPRQELVLGRTRVEPRFRCRRNAVLPEAAEDRVAPTTGDRGPCDATGLSGPILLAPPPSRRRMNAASSRRVIARQRQHSESHLGAGSMTSPTLVCVVARKRLGLMAVGVLGDFVELPLSGDALERGGTAVFELES